MAHNYYRIPLRIRWKSLHDMKNSEAETLERSRCRRHRRKLRYLLHLYELRMKAGGRWMETHIWHAKRFKMEDAWGVRYPTRCSDKSDRSTYRLTSKDSACIIDKSYFCHYRIKVSSIDDLSEFYSNLNIKAPQTGNFSLMGKVFDNENILIAPVQVTRIEQMIYLGLHPSVT